MEGRVWPARDELIVAIWLSFSFLVAALNIDSACDGAQLRHVRLQQASSIQSLPVEDQGGRISWLTVFGPSPTPIKRTPRALVPIFTI